MPQPWTKWWLQISISLMRLPKNLKSNRWWIVWKGQIFFVTNSSQNSSVGNTKNRQEILGPGWRSYRRLGARKTQTEEIPRSSQAVFIPELGMFGNMTRRLAAGLLVAKVHELGHVVVPDSAEFQAGIYEKGVHDFAGGPRLWLWTRNGSPSTRVNVLHTRDLLYGPQVKLDLHGRESEEAWANLFSVLANKPDPQFLPEDHLVIHLRGGDVFGDRKPASYGQPPLAFYDLILNREKWSAVTVVHQDLKNPVLDSLLQSCKARKMHVTTHSGAAKDDIKVLLTAKTLVAGRGTFMPAVVGLSRVVSRVFFFEDKFSVHPTVTDLDVIRVRDAEGTYVREVLSNNWQNSAHQRNLMLSYPSSNLEVGALD